MACSVLRLLSPVKDVLQLTCRASSTRLWWDQGLNLQVGPRARDPQVIRFQRLCFLDKDFIRIPCNENIFLLLVFSMKDRDLSVTPFE